MSRLRDMAIELIDTDAFKIIVTLKGMGIKNIDGPVEVSLFMASIPHLE